MTIDNTIISTIKNLISNLPTTGESSTDSLFFDKIKEQLNSQIIVQKNDGIIFRQNIYLKNFNAIFNYNYYGNTHTIRTQYFKHLSNNIIYVK